MECSDPENSREKNILIPEGIKQNTKRRFMDVLSWIQSGADAANAIHACKQLLRVKADIDITIYESLLLQLCRLLSCEKRFGEVLYYYMATPYYLGSMLNAGELISNANLKDTAFSNVIRSLHQHRKKINVLLYNSNIDRIQNLKDTIKIACCQNVYVITDHMELLKQETGFIKNYDILIIANNYNSQSMTVIDKFKKKFSSPLLFILHCYTLEEAKRMYLQMDRKVDYITYNDKMIYAVLHIVLHGLQT